MIANNDMNRWCALYTAPRSERKLMQRLNEAGYAAFCPMQIVFRKWNGKTKEVFTPLFPGFLFVEETADVASFVASQNVALLVDAEGKRLSVCAEKAELAAEFAHLLKELLYKRLSIFQVYHTHRLHVFENSEYMQSVYLALKHPASCQHAGAYNAGFIFEFGDCDNCILIYQIQRIFFYRSFYRLCDIVLCQ